MNSDEEYLDDLLKSIMESEDEADSSEAEKEADLEDITEGDGDGTSTNPDVALEDDFFLNDFAIQEPDIDDMEDIDTMFAGADAMAIEDIGAEEEGFAEVSEYNEDELHLNELNEEEYPQDENFLGVEEPLQLDEEMDADDMLALLESMSDEIEAEASREKLSAEEENTFESEEGSEDKKGKKEKKVKKDKKEKKKWFAKKADKEQIDGEEESIGDGEVEEVGASKKKGLIAKVFSFLMESDEGEDETEKLKAQHGMAPSDENRDILEALDAEDKKKKKKKAKKNKANDSSEEDDDPDKKAKEKKPKKAKVIKEKSSDPVIPGKKVSGKNIAIISSLCLTLAVMMIVLVTVVPDFFDKTNARTAYYETDYASSYELLYGKKLDDTDTVIYNRSKIILSLNRKLSAYHNYMSMGKELEALDALMSGVEKYPDILYEAEEYGVTEEVEAVYATILNVLNDKYYLSEPVAKVIVDYEDDLVYTRKLRSIVYKTPFELPEEEEQQMVQAPSVSADLLPEEQALLGEEVLTDEPASTTAVRNSDSIILQSEGFSSEEETEDSEVQDIMEESPVQSPPAEEDLLVEEEPVQEEASMPSISSPGSQGQLIQGIRQPINIQINGN